MTNDEMKKLLATKIVELRKKKEFHTIEVHRIDGALEAHINTLAFMDQQEREAKAAEAAKIAAGEMYDPTKPPEINETALLGNERDQAAENDTDDTQPEKSVESVADAALRSFGGNGRRFKE